MHLSEMRVLTVVHDLGPGGTQRVAQNFTNGYQAKGHAAAVLSVRGGGPRVKALTGRGTPVFIGGACPSEQDEAVTRAVEWRPNVIHVHRPGRSDRMTGSVLRRLRSALADHHVVLETNVFGKADYSADRLLIDLHMPLTRWSLWKWARWTSGMRPRPVGVVMPNLVDTSVFRPASEAERERYRDAAEIPLDAFVFGRVGQPIESKWSPLIFEAFAEVISRRQNAYLLLAGLPPRLSQHVGKLPLAVRSRVVEAPFIHADAELRACYGAMDVFLHASSIGESFGLVLVEAMLAKRPVITLSTPARDNSQLEVVGHERGGLVVTDKRRMVEAMERLIEDRSLLERLGQRGAESVRRRYDLSEQIDTLVKIANIALRAETHDRLRADLEADPELITNVSTAEIKGLLSQSLGRPPLKDRLLMNVVHIGWLYRLYSRLLFPLLKG
jgi:glycosyltransferase involved in cell wall biosynthesis